MPAYLYAGSFCLQEDEFDLALKYLNVALKVEPKNATALFYKGVALVELKKEKEGCSCLSKAFYAGEDDAGDYLKQYCFGLDD
jgi:tetratricopeptide (TPR) repeat protein